jgi:UPF0755 protein
MSKFMAKLIGIALLAGAALLVYAFYVPAGPTQEKLVKLKSHTSARHIAAELRQAGIIHNEYAFLVWHYAHGRRVLKAGEYAFSHPARLKEVYERLVRGDIYVHTLVIPEGYNMFDIAQAIEDEGLGKRVDFLNVAHSDVSLVRDLDPQAPTLEGYLFPDTYHFTGTQSLHEIAAVMVRRFRQAAREAGLTGDLHNVVTMASIVEKETAVDTERPEVASVFYNRLNRHMILATDPTVIYAALLNNRYRGTIYRSDLQYDSPYNTYKNQGLPPGPICNPGKASLEAAMRPANTPYLFFVSDNQGHHRFSSTPEEHARNVAAYRRAVAGVNR